MEICQDKSTTECISSCTGEKKKDSYGKEPIILFSMGDLWWGGERERERENADKKQEVFFRCLVHHRNNKLRKLLTLVSLAPYA